jgi:hypothetical protein
LGGSMRTYLFGVDWIQDPARHECRRIPTCMLDFFALEKACNCIAGS